MQNLENLDVFEILITQKLLKCLKDPFVRSALICIYKQLLVTAAIFKTIRHKIYLKTLKNVRYSKKKSKSRIETLKIPTSVSCETKLKFVEIVMISVSDLAPALAIFGVIPF